MKERRGRRNVEGDIKRRASMAGQCGGGGAAGVSQILSRRLLLRHLKYWLRYGGVWCVELYGTGYLQFIQVDEYASDGNSPRTVLTIQFVEQNKKKIIGGPPNSLPCSGFQLSRSTPPFSFLYIIPLLRSRKIQPLACLH